MESDDEYAGEDIPELDNQAPLPTKEHSVYSGKPALKVLTPNDIVRYAQARIHLAEEKAIEWPPIMRLVFQKATNMTELTMCMLELLLDVPIQVRLTFGKDSFIDLNDPEVHIPYNNMLFAEATAYAKHLLKEGFLTTNDVRPNARKLFEYRPQST